MPFSTSDPVLAALDVERLVEFYETKLGFKRSWCDANYGIVKRDEIAIHFWHCNNPIFPQNTSCYLWVTEIDSLYQEFQAANVIHPNGPLENKPWGVREFSALDQDGNLLRIGELPTKS
ncbi:MAG: VOC family protein [Bacteroidota bacterium]